MDKLPALEQIQVHVFTAPNIAVNMALQEVPEQKIR
jgi:hypothetical protein